MATVRICCPRSDAFVSLWYFLRFVSLRMLEMCTNDSYFCFVWSETLVWVPHGVYVSRISTPKRRNRWVVPKRRHEMTTTGCVTTRKNAARIGRAAWAWYHPYGYFLLMYTIRTDISKFSGVFFSCVCKNFRNSTVRSVVSPPIVRHPTWSNSTHTGSIFRKIDISFFEKCYWNLTKITCALHEDLCAFMEMSRTVLFTIRIVSHRNCRANQNTHFISSKYPSSKFYCGRN